MNLRDENGVRYRYDAKGDAWSDAHRKAFGKNSNDYYMGDFDTIFGAMGFGASTGDKLFVEYECYKDIEYAEQLNFIYVAYFDRKVKKPDIRIPYTRQYVCAQMYADHCRKIGMAQSFSPKYFIVVGAQSPPWTMYEIDINSVNYTGVQYRLGQTNWQDIWEIVGLNKLRMMAKEVLRKSNRNYVT